MTILSDYIKHLHLNADAPYPWQVLRDEQAMAEAKAEILKARKLHYGPKLALVDSNGYFPDRDSGDNGVDPDSEGREA